MALKESTMDLLITIENTSRGAVDGRAKTRELLDLCWRSARLAQGKSLIDKQEKLMLSHIKGSGDSGATVQHLMDITRRGVEGVPLIIEHLRVEELVEVSRPRAGLPPRRKVVTITERGWKYISHNNL